jgi:hypothetical protein
MKKLSVEYPMYFGAKPIYQVMDKVSTQNKTTLKLTVTETTELNQNDFADWADATLMLYLPGYIKNLDHG